MKTPTFTFKNRGDQIGLTLVELMVAMTLGLILMAAVIQIFIGSKQSYRVTDNTSRVQENGRYAVEALSSDIRMAGYLGCSKNSTVNNIASPTTSSWIQFSQAIIGYTSASVPTSSGLTSAQVLSGTDVLQIQRASSSGVKLTGNLAATNANIQITGNPTNIQVDDILVISDCSNADVFRANSVSNASGTVTITHSNASNTTNFLSKAYQSNAELLRLVTDIYYVGSGTGTCPANMLCRGSINITNFASLNVEQLVDNVEALTFLYGIDTDGDAAANKYIAAGSVTASDWVNVVSVRYSIRIRTPEDNIATATASGDRRIRRTFGATVAVRNNIP